MRLIFSSFLNLKVFRHENLIFASFLAIYFLNFRLYRKVSKLHGFSGAMGVQMQGIQEVDRAQEWNDCLLLRGENKSEGISEQHLGQNKEIYWR